MSEVPANYETDPGILEPVADGICWRNYRWPDHSGQPVCDCQRCCADTGQPIQRNDISAAEADALTNPTILRAKFPGLFRDEAPPDNLDDPLPQSGGKRPPVPPAGQGQPVPDNGWPNFVGWTKEQIHYYGQKVAEYQQDGDFDPPELADIFCYRGCACVQHCGLPDMPAICLGDKHTHRTDAGVVTHEHKMRSAGHAMDWAIAHEGMTPPVGAPPPPTELPESVKQYIADRKAGVYDKPACEPPPVPPKGMILTEEYNWGWHAGLRYAADELRHLRHQYGYGDGNHMILPVLDKILAEHQPKDE